MALTPEQAIDTADRGLRPASRVTAPCTPRAWSAGARSRPPPTPRRLTRAAHMQGPRCRSTVRFSNGSGNPEHPDWAPDPRGLAVKFYLPDGSRTDIVAVSTPRFPTRTPEGFIELIRRRRRVRRRRGSSRCSWRRHPEALQVLPGRGADAAAAGQLRDDPLLRAARLPVDRRRRRRALRPLHARARRRGEPGSRPWAARRRGRDYLQDGDPRAAGGRTGAVLARGADRRARRPGRRPQRRLAAAAPAGDGRARCR